MAKINLLSDVLIKKAKPKEKKYLLSDGGGLYLSITPNGNKVWVYKYTINSKRRETTFKSYPAVSLIIARQKRDEANEKVYQGIDPIHQKQEKEQEHKKEVDGVFSKIADNWLEKKKSELSPATYLKKVRQFQRDVYPFIGDKHIRDIKTDDVKKLIQLKEIQAAETARKMLADLKNVFRYGVISNYCDFSIINDIAPRDILKATIEKHHPKITNLIVLKELVNAIYIYSGTHDMRNLLKFVLHVPLRADNLCALKWEYINFKDKTLTIPRQEMKVKNPNLDDFVLPLTDEVVSILKEQKEINKYKEYVFYGISGLNPVNRKSPNKALKMMGFNNEEQGRKIRLHGFRGTFRSVVETLDIDGRFGFETKERALDHHEQNKVVRAYSHKANHIKQLRALFDFWSGYIVSLRA